MILINRREFYKKYHASYNFYNKRNEIKYRKYLRTGNNKINFINRFLQQKRKYFISKKYKRDDNIICKMNLMESKCYNSKLLKNEYGQSPILFKRSFITSKFLLSSSSPSLLSSSLLSSSSSSSSLSLSSSSLSSSNNSSSSTSTSSMPVVVGITSASLVFLVILFIIFKRTNYAKKFSFSCTRKIYIFNEDNNNNNNNDDTNRTISNLKYNDKIEEIIKLPTPVVTISSSKNRGSVTTFNYNSDISIKMYDSSHYDFLKTKINYLDQGFDNYFKPVHGLFDKDLIDEINDKIKDEFELQSFPVNDVNWEECMK
ncbi:unnamed protein product [Rhizophagus irregularis]|nr:unnamed protein product [Rhizophagus irregularis]CAB5358889.1 unnamed protein product [Rhizophagus irregularis]